MRQIRRHTSTSFPRNFLKNQACWPEPPGQARTRSPSHLPGQTVIGTKALSLLFLRRKVASDQLLHKDMSASLQAGARAIVYFVQAGAYARMGVLASRVVTAAPDPQFLEHLLPHLEAATYAAPKGEARWTCLSNLADALRRAGRPDQSLGYYQQAADLARMS